jgi:hypothetical protein
MWCGMCHVSYVLCGVVCVMCHMSYVVWYVSCVICPMRCGMCHMFYDAGKQGAMDCGLQSRTVCVHLLDLTSKIQDPRSYG